MKLFCAVALIILAVTFCTEVDEASTYHKYREACTGIVGDSSTKYGAFVENTLKRDEDSLLTVCKTEYFKNIPSTCDEEHKKCVKAVQQFMWDRCHWRFLYYIEENVPSLISHMDSTLGEDSEEIKGLFDAMNEDDHIYDFASKCGSWDWAGIGIMLLCSFFGSYILLWIIGGIMRLFKKNPEKSEKEQ